MERTVWKIRIAGYGTFEFTGTEAEADRRRADKAIYEQGMGMMWRKDLSRESDRLAAEIAAIFDSGKGASCELIKKWTAARRAEKVT
jgi:hypothetical protein